MRERLEREFDLDLISTAPNVVYEVTMDDGSVITVTNPSEYPAGKVAEVREPIVRSTILAPSEFIGAIMELCQNRRGTLLGMDYLSEDRVELRYTLPLAEIVFDFFDQLKSQDPRLRLARLRAGRGAGGRPGQGRHPAAGRAGRRVQRDRAQGQGLRLRRRDDGQAARADPAPAVRGADPGGHRRADHRRENIRAIRKDVLAKCYGGDITRKRKLLEKQKEGKKRMKMVGRVEVPQEAFIAALSNDSVAGEKTRK